MYIYIYICICIYMSRRTFDAVGAFICASAEDLAFFHAHIDRVPRAEYPLVRTCVYSCIYVYICICLCIYVYVYVYVCPDEPSTLSVLFFFCAPAEDLALFHAHLDNVPRAERPLVRSSAPFVYDKCTPMKHLTPRPPHYHHHHSSRPAAAHTGMETPLQYKGGYGL